MSWKGLAAGLALPFLASTAQGNIEEKINTIENSECVEKVGRYEVKNADYTIILIKTDMEYPVWRENSKIEKKAEKVVEHVDDILGKFDDVKIYYCGDNRKSDYNSIQSVSDEVQTEFQLTMEVFAAYKRMYEEAILDNNDSKKPDRHDFTTSFNKLIRIGEERLDKSIKKMVEERGNEKYGILIADYIDDIRGGEITGNYDNIKRFNKDNETKVNLISFHPKGIDFVYNEKVRDGEGRLSSRKDSVKKVSKLNNTFAWLGY